MTLTPGARPEAVEPPGAPACAAFRLDGADQTLALAVRGGGLPEVVWWGPALPPGEDMALLARAAEIDRTGGALDAVAPLSLCPEAARGFPGQPGLALRDAGGRVLSPRFEGAAVAVTDAGLAVSARDDALGLDWRGTIALDRDTGVITLAAELRSEAPVLLDWLAAPVLPGPQLSDGMIDVAGRWLGEFRLCRAAWAPGIRLRESRTGRSGHENFPGFVLLGRGTTATGGEAWAFHYGWSGGHRMIAEELPDGRRQIQFGHAAGSERAPGTAFRTAPLHAAFSSRGTNGTATAFQRHVRDRIVVWPRRSRPRPVHYNCWEAVYFDHDTEVLKDIAGRAAALGAERFVLDDGWFGRRDDDTTSLGDWEVDRRKHPGGLGPLIDHVRGLGMGFGLWVEPEMASPGSDLLRAHPDWALGPEGQTLGRHQLALDMSRPEVRDHLHGRLAALLSAHAIEYLKWDHNRVLPGADAAQARGTHALIDRLRADFPEVEIETCASGGGRLDFGMLARTQRVWLSDSNDALERLRIQHDAALFLPGAVTGSHVGPRRCHTSGREIDIRFRAWVAASRHLGFEMDPRELSPDEAAVLTRVTRWWKARRDFLEAADILRLESADPAVLAEQHVDPGAGRFLVFAGRVAASDQTVPRPLRLARLDPGAAYRVELVNRDERAKLSRGDPALAAGPVTLSGRALMAQGVVLPWSFPETMWVLEGTRRDAVAGGEAAR